MYSDWEPKNEIKEPNEQFHHDTPDVKYPILPLDAVRHLKFLYKHISESLVLGSR